MPARFSTSGAATAATITPAGPARTTTRLLAAADRTADPAARAALLRRAESLLLAAAPVIPLYFNTHVFLLQPSVRGWHPTLLDHHPYKDVWLEP